MNDVKWIKLSVGMPDNRKIKKIRRLPDGNNIILIWVFLLLKAAESNKKGGLFFLEDMPYTIEDLADEFDFSIELIQFALRTLEHLNMIETYDEVIYIKNWDRYQNVEGMERTRKLNRERNQRYRERKKQKKLESDVSVTSHDGTDIDIELEEELDIDKERDKVPYAEIIKYLNEKAGKRFKHTANKTRDLIKARWNEGNRLDDFKHVIDVCCKKWSGQVFGNGQIGDEYLRPSTLFNGKFDERLNWSIEKEKPVYEVKDDEGSNEQHSEEGGDVRLFR